ncbi:hypothetical protein [Prosthecobacter sp.]|uniref:hypothetical protein n=1 Tax=Prosthecobacter sp. TaxID=1965333 RepID=UPI0037840AA4
MKSQKINNRAPRPFKTKADRWSGGQNFIPFSGPKPAAKPLAAKPAEKKSDGK